MEIEERLKTLEKDFNEFKDEIKELLLDIRGHIMEAQNPLKAFEGKKSLTSSPKEPEKGVTENGD
jgi:hypothetical protein